MRVRRAQTREKRHALIRQLKKVVQEVERELLAKGEL